MKIEINKLKDSQTEILVAIPAEAFDKIIETTIEALGKDVEVQGFRKGKAPKNIVEKSLGEENILHHAGEEAVKMGYSQAVRDNKLEIIGRPEIKVTKSARGNDFEFKAVVSVLPSFNLPDYKKSVSKLKLKEVKAEDKEVQDSINYLQSSMAQMEDKEGLAEDGNWVEIEFSINGNAEQKDAFILGKGKLIPEIEKNILSMKKEEEKEFEFAFPKKEEKAKCKIKLTGLKTVNLPEINDEFVKKIGPDLKNVQDLKDRIKEDIIKGKTQQAEQELIGQLLAGLSKDIKDLEVPSILVESEIEQNIENFKKRIETQTEMSFDDYLKQSKKTEEDLKNELRPKTKERIKEYLILKEIQKKEDIKVSEEEINKEVEAAAQRQPQVDLANLIEYTKERIENEKTYKKILEFVGK